MALKLKTRTVFPSVVTVESPILLVKEGVRYTFSLDADAISATFDPLYAKLTNNLSDLAFKYTALDNLSIHGANIASAATVNLETATGDLVDVTGTVSITAITLSEGHERTVRFTGALTLTNGASLVLPGGANITTAAGDFAVFRGYAAGVVRCVQYNPVTGKATIPPAVSEITGYATGIAAFLATPSSANLLAALTDETGTGAAVFAGSPALTGTPTAPTAAAGTNTTQLATTAGIVAERAAAKTLTNTTLDSAGTGNVLKVSGVTVSSGQYPGETTTGNAVAGNVGEYVEGVVTSGSAVSLSSTTAKTVVSISLTAGDWDVDCSCYFLPGATTTVTQLAAAIHTVTDTLDTTPGRFSQMAFTSYTPNVVAQTQNVPPYRFSLSSTTTIFMVAKATFGTSTLGGYGLLRARRAR